MSEASSGWLAAIVDDDLDRFEAWLAGDVDVNASHASKTILHHAAQRGRSSMIELLVERGASLDGAEGGSLLHAAAQGGALPFARRLLDAGVPVDALDAEGSTPLCDAAFGGRCAVLEVLLARGADPAVRVSEGRWRGHAALEIAVRRGAPRCAAALVRAGARYEPDFVPPIARWKTGTSVFADMLLGWRREDPDPPAEFARESLEAMAAVLVAAAAPAAPADPLEDLALLLRDRASERDLKEAREVVANAASSDRAQALATAVSKGDVDRVKALLPTASRNGLVALIKTAAAGGRAEIVRLLVEDPRLAREEIFRRGTACDALFEAVRRGHLDVVKALVEKGADLDAWSEGDGQYTPESALGIALQGGHVSIARYLAESGARPERKSPWGSSMAPYVADLEELAAEGDDGRASLAHDVRRASALAHCEGAEALAWFVAERSKHGKPSKRTDLALLLVDAILRDDAARVTVVLDAGASPDVALGKLRPLDVAHRFGASGAAAVLVGRGATTKRHQALVPWVATSPDGAAASPRPAAPKSDPAAEFLTQEAVARLELAGSTPLHAACERRNAAAIASLLRGGADPNARARAGYLRAAKRTPLFELMGSSLGAGDTLGPATLLLDAGADVNAVDAAGTTPLDLALLKSMRVLLRERGGLTGRQVAELR